jgi:hypothetical protein
VALNQGRRSLVQLPQNGGCLCGALRYEITHMPIAVYTCHCTNCQRLLGSAFSMSFIVADEAYHLSGGDPRPIRRITDSGHTATRWIGLECATIICSGSKPGLPSAIAIRSVRAGTLDDTSWLRPTARFWTRSAQPWVVLPPDGQRFETQPADTMGFLLSQQAEGRGF